MLRKITLCLFLPSSNNLLKIQNNDLVLKIHDDEVELVKETKYLGVQIDCSLDWKEQIMAVSSMVFKGQ